MSDQSIIAPASHKPVGAVPRNLLVGGLLIITLVAMVWFALSEEPPRRESSEVVQARLAEAASAAIRGNPAAVEEAEAAASAAVRRKVMDRERTAAAAPAMPFGQPVTGGVGPGTGPVPAGAPSFGIPPPRSMRASGPHPAIDAGEAERERATRDSEAVVMDRSGESGLSAMLGLGGAPARNSQAGGSTLAEPGGSSPAGGGVLANLPGAGAAASTNAALLELAKQHAGNRGPVGRVEGQAKWLTEAAAKAGERSDALIMSPPAGRFLVPQGRVIPAVLSREITSDVPGTITARSTEHVYDSAGNLMIPRGSEFVGSYNSDVAFGQSRMSAAFTRLRLPNGATFALPAAQAADALGRSGVTGDVDRHYIQTFGAALLLGLLADRVTQENKVPDGGMAGTTGSVSATGQVFVDTARVELERTKAIAPTITVPAGSRINVEVVKDMLFPAPYKNWSN